MRDNPGNESGTLVKTGWQPLDSFNNWKVGLTNIIKGLIPSTDKSTTSIAYKWFTNKIDYIVPFLFQQWNTCLIIKFKRNNISFKNLYSIIVNLNTKLEEN